MKQPYSQNSKPSLKVSNGYTKGMSLTTDVTPSDDIRLPGLPPTPEQASCLRRISAPLPWVVYAMALVELCETSPFASD